MFGGTGSEGANGVTLDSAGNAWITGVTNSADFPVTASAADSSFNGVADAFVSELSAGGSALLYSTYLGGTQSESGNDFALDPGGNVYVTGHTYSMDFPVTSGAFDTIFNGDTSIFWGDAFVTKIATGTDSSTPPAPPAIPGAPSLLTPSNGEAAWQPVTVRLERRAERRVVHAAGRRFERVQRAARAQSEPHGVVVRRQRTGDHAALLACSRREFGRGCRRVVGGAQLHARAPAPSGRVVDARHQSLDGRGRERLERDGGPERGRARERRAHHAVQQQSRGCERAGSGHGARQQLHGALYHRDLAGSGQHDGHDHRGAQRRDENRDADGDARGVRAAAGGPAESGAESVQRRGRFQFAGHRDVVRRRTSNRRRRVAVEQQSGRCRRAGQPHRASGSHVRDVHHLDGRRQRVNAGDDLGDLQRHDADGRHVTIAPPSLKPRR